MRVGSERVSFAWDNSAQPVVEIGVGGRVEVDLLDASNGQLGAESTAQDVPLVDFSRVNPVTGPIAVVDVHPGDALVVRIESLDTAATGWSAVIPGFGLLADDFPDPAIVHSRITDDGVELDFGLRLPRLPMIGTLGVALPEPGAHPLLPPSRFGGNLDVRQLTAGATIRLPVGVEQALLSLGDTHATMGDGEVCGTGVETNGRVTLVIDVERGAAPPAPVIETAGTTHRSGPAVMTTGVGPDLMIAAKDATRAMIDAVVRRTGISAERAYVLASLAADLVISEVVDAPNWVVSLHLPVSVLG